MTERPVDIDDAAATDTVDDTVNRALRMVSALAVRRGILSDSVAIGCLIHATGDAMARLWS